MDVERLMTDLPYQLRHEAELRERRDPGAGGILLTAADEIDRQSTEIERLALKIADLQKQNAVLRESLDREKELVDTAVRNLARLQR